MMKKLLCLGLSFVLALAIIPVGSKDFNQHSTAVKAASSAEKTEDLLNGFNNYNDILANVYGYDFGDASLNTNKKYITEGDGSLRYVVGNVDRRKDVLFSSDIKVMSTGYDFKGDFSKVDRVTVDVFNDTEEREVTKIEGDKEVTEKLNTDVNVEIAATTGIPQYNRYINSVKTKRVAKKGEWTTITLDVNRSALDIMADINNVNYIDLTFTGINSVVYVDNLKIYYRNDDFEKINMYLDENEFCSFDKNYQRITVTGNTTEGLQPILEFNTNPEFAKNGCSLKVTLPAHNFPYEVWMSFQFSSKLFELANMAARQERGETLVFDLKCVDEQNVWAFAGLKNEGNGKTSVTLPFNGSTQWQEVRIPLADAVFNPIGLVFDFCHFNKEFSFYLDNIRFE